MATKIVKRGHEQEPQKFAVEFSHCPCSRAADAL